MMTTIYKYTFISVTLLILFTSNADANNKKDITWLQLPKEYIVSGTNAVIYLHEIVETIKGENAEYIAQILPVPVMETPEPGTHRRLAHHQIILALRQAGFDTLDIRFEGNQLVEVYGPGQKVTRTEMVDAIENKILRETGLNADDFRLQVVSSPPYDSWLKPGAYEIHVDRVNPSVLGTSRYNVRFIQDRILAKEEAFLVNIARKREVFMPVDNLGRGTVIRPENIHKEIRYVDQEAKDKLYVDNINEIIGKKCRNNLRQTDIITWNMLETNFVVNRGETVRAMLNSDKFTMQTTAKTESRGAPGDIIPIKMELTGKIVNARVMNGDMVEIVTEQ